MRQLVFLFSFFTAFNTMAAIPLVPAEPLKPVSEAPPGVLEASKSIVGIEIGDGAGTGFFISEDGLLLTNRHVVGASECARNGCFLTLKMNWNGQPGQESVEQYFATPLVTVAELDMAVLQIWEAPPKERHLEPTEKFRSPKFLSPMPDPGLGESVYVLGHAFGGIQRWSTGKLQQVRGDWRGAEILVLPGMSGSPVVNEKGGVVGIVHRSVNDGSSVLDLSKLRHAGYYTAWTAFDRFWKNRAVSDFENTLEEYTTVPADKVVDPEDFADFMQNGGEFEVMLGLLRARRQSSILIDTSSEEEELAPKKKKSAKAKPAKKEPKTTEFKIGELLLKLCTAEVGSEETAIEPDYDYHVCQTALDWFDCKDAGEAKDPDLIPIHGMTEEGKKNWEYRFCPSAEDQKAWKKIFVEVTDLLELKNQDAIPWLITSAGVFETTKVAETAATKTAVEAFLAQHPGLSEFERALAISSWAASLDEKVDDTHTVGQVLTGYRQSERRALFFEELLSTVQMLAGRGMLPDVEGSPLVHTFLHDGEIPVSHRIDLESSLLSRKKYAGFFSGSKRSRRTHNSKKIEHQQIRKSMGAALSSDKGLFR